MHTTFLHQVTEINNRLHLAQNIDCLIFGDSFDCLHLSLISQIAYHAYCDDFGPMNMACIVDFIRHLEAKLAVNTSEKKIVLCVAAGRQL
jgi:hypothetical protein